MKAFVKWGALAILALIAAAVVVPASGNPWLVFPIWLGISYAIASVTLPADRKAIAAPFALLCGQVAFRVLAEIVADPGLVANVLMAALGLGAAWLFVSGSARAAAALIAVQLVVLARAVPYAPRVVESFGSAPLAASFSATVQMYLAPLLTILLLAPRLARRPKPSIAAVFD
jgi:hypothetical protein